MIANGDRCYPGKGTGAVGENNRWGQTMGVSKRLSGEVQGKQAHLACRQKEENVCEL